MFLSSNLVKWITYVFYVSLMYFIYVLQCKNNVNNLVKVQCMDNRFNSINQPPRPKSNLLAGCSKCESKLREGEKDKIGRLRRHWDHVSAARQIKECRTSTGKDAIASQTGYK